MLSSSIIFGLSSMIGYGVLNVLISRASKKDNSFKVSYLIQILGFIATLLLYPFFGKGFIDIKFFLLLSVLGIIDTISYFALIKGMSMGAVSIVTPIVQSFAIITVSLNVLILGEEIGLHKMIEIAVTIIGIIILTTNLKLLVKEKTVKLVKGIKWAIVTFLGWGIGFFLLGIVGRNIGWYYANLGLRFWVVLTFLAVSPFFKINAVKSFIKVPPLIFLIAVIDTLVFLLFNAGLVKGSASLVSVFVSASPLITLLISTTILKEKLLLSQKIGVILCLFGIIFLSIP